MSDLPTREEVLADLPEQRAGVYSGDEWDTVIVAYDMELLMTRAEWKATIDYEAAMIEYQHQVEGFLAQIGFEVEKWEPNLQPACKIVDAAVKDKT